MKSNNIINIAIVGGGPSGIIAAYAASLNPNVNIDLFERNEKLGKKLYITGKGRCNLTNSGEAQDFFDAISHNEKFFYSAYYTFDNYALMSLIENCGVKLVSERGNRVFPESGRSSDIIHALKHLINKKNIQIHLNSKVNKISSNNEKFMIDCSDKSYDKVIVTGGGMSYPVTGSDGNTYKLAKNFGHKITDINPGLCGINTSDSDTYKLSGLSLKNVTLTIKKDNKEIYSKLGEMEFTHFGISGPLVLSASLLVNNENLKQFEYYIDLKSGLDEGKLEARIIRDITEEPKKEIKNTLGKLLPYKLMETVLLRSGSDITKQGSQLTKEERKSIIDNLKRFKVNPISLRPIEDAIITRGGISCSEINPSTMESKIVRGLYFAGEVIDLDACTGGYNLQIAFSTGYLAGLSASE